MKLVALTVKKGCWRGKGTATPSEEIKETLNMLSFKILNHFTRALYAGQEGKQVA